MPKKLVSELTPNELAARREYQRHAQHKHYLKNRENIAAYKARHNQTPEGKAVAAKAWRKWLDAHPGAHQQMQRAYYRRKHGTSEKVGQDAFVAVYAAIPRNLPPDVRDEVAGTLFMALVDGTLRAADLSAKVREYVRAYNRQNDHYKVLSLDDKIPGMETSWVDNLPDDAEHF